jgi:hypothetical protein
MNKIFKIKIFFLTVPLLVLFDFQFVFAQKFIPFIKIEGFEGGEVTGLTLAKYIEALYKWGIRVIAILAIVMIIKAGFTWMVSAGNPALISKARNQIISAIVGLILILGANIFLSSINPVLTKLKSLNLQKIKPLGPLRERWDYVIPIATKDYYLPYESTAGEIKPNKQQHLFDGRKCGSADYIEDVIPGKGLYNITIFGTECENDNEVCVLHFTVDEKKYSEWKEKKLKGEPIDDGYPFFPYLGSWGECKSIGKESLLALPDHSEIKKYTLDQKIIFQERGLSYYDIWTCGDEPNGKFTIKEFDGEVGLNCSNDHKTLRPKGCTYITFIQQPSTQTGEKLESYFTYHLCSYKAKYLTCPLDKRRVKCEKCSSDPYCSDDHVSRSENKKICCEDRNGQYTLYPY